ncbi:MAG: DUF4390 domain-containing protein, partial [Candidatus Krumholzibacteria bacterium]|nr:DUF4390 domain-containing protein [Candidatus Krumholzibacteria bacterium]
MTRSRLWANACLLGLVLAGMVDSSTCLAERLDSLKTYTLERAVRAGFVLPIRELKAAGIEQALDEGLEIECRVTIEINQRGRSRLAIWRRFMRQTLTRNAWVRTLRYDQWYDEYVIEDNDEESFRHQSYYQSIDRFRRFNDLSALSLALLEPDKVYTASIEITVRRSLSNASQQASNVEVAGAAAWAETDAVVKQSWRLMKKKDMFHIKLESQKFTSDTVPSPLFQTPESESP